MRTMNLVGAVSKGAHHRVVVSASSSRGPPCRSGEDPDREQRLVELKRDDQGAPWLTVLVKFGGFLAVVVGSFAAVGLLLNLGHGVAGWGPPALTLLVLAGAYLGLRMLRRRRRAWRQTTNVRRRSPILLVGALVAVLVLLAGTAVFWSQDRGRGPAASVQPCGPPDQLLIRRPCSCWWTGSSRPARPPRSRWSAPASRPGRGPAALVTCRPGVPPAPPTASGLAA
jgi:hypothetical protein